MTVQDQNRGTRLSFILTGQDELALGADLQSRNTAIKLNEQISRSAEHSPKARKPYTIRKQREKWTDEEHNKFLEALKLYGRAWRRIEEHVGTKTTIQIRSHAQKFFSKVVRDSRGGSMAPIEIPPPRPKRKPNRPYPRKLTDPLINIVASKLDQQRYLSPNSSSSEEEQSPTSVLCAVGSGSIVCPIEEIGFSSRSPPVAVASVPYENLGLFPNLCIGSKFEAKEASDCAGHIKLFGTVLHAEGSTSNIKDMNEKKPQMMSQWLTLSSENTRNLAPLYHGSPYAGDIGDGEVYNNRHWDELKIRSEIRVRELNVGRNSRSRMPEFLLGSKIVPGRLGERNKGFMPYKRFIAEKTNCATVCSE
ncbi:hypothetical protein SAY87_011454 [Trapa incisa]|uniref:Uncharacterized protein n=1 Tax=Trapa incisa TaxID=236973 RepID=A0AAN7GRY8_9MYRT|nr:hypothetical protein SAY87_011454 [Trapa incisa]